MHIVAVLKAHPVELAKAVVAVCSLIIVGLLLLQRKFQQRGAAEQPLPTMEQLLAGSRNPAPATRTRYGTVPHTRPTSTDRIQLSRLEAHLSQAILNADVRRRLVNHAMKTTGGDRAAAIRKVLRDLERDNSRWD